MPLSIATFQNEITSLGNIYRAMGYPAYKAELTLLATALGTDPTTYPSTIQTAPGILNPSLWTNTYYIDRVDLLINKGKASGLLPAAMATAITNAVAALP
jgi:hypothetical protein